jgi:hypothetical protein
VDTRPGRPKLIANILRPFQRMSLADYKHVVLEARAQPMVDGKRQRQKYYFNGF